MQLSWFSHTPACFLGSAPWGNRPQPDAASTRCNHSQVSRTLCFLPPPASLVLPRCAPGHRLMSCTTARKQGRFILVVLFFFFSRTALHGWYKSDSVCWKPPPKVKKSPGQSAFFACPPQTKTNPKAPKVQNVPFKALGCGPVGTHLPGVLETWDGAPGLGLYSQHSVQRQEDQKFSWLHSKFEAAQDMQDFV